MQVGKIRCISLAVHSERWKGCGFLRTAEDTKSVQDRVEGFMNNIGKYGDIEVVETIYSDQVDDMEASMKGSSGKIIPHWMVYSAPMQILQRCIWNLEKSDEHDATALVA